MTTAFAPALAPVSTTVRPPVRAGAPSPAALVGIEVRKSLSTRSGRSLAVASMLLAPAATAIVAAASDESLGSVVGPLGVMGMLTGLVLLSLGVLSTAGEWTHRTVQTTYLLVPRRGRVLAAKTVAVALIGAVAAAVAVALTAAVLAGMVDGASWDGAGRAVGVFVAAGAVFAVIGAGVGAALANTPAALTSLYLVILGVLPVVRTFKPEVGSKLDPAEAVLALSQGQAQTQSVLVLTGWVVVALVAGAVVTRRRAVA
jgi:ABC-2 type transport system permease protein